MTGVLRRAIRWCVDQATPEREQPSPYCYLYLRSGTTIRGFLVGHTRDGYIVARAEVAPEGSAAFRQLKERVVIPAVEFYTTDSPSVR